MVCQHLAGQSQVILLWGHHGHGGVGNGVLGKFDIAGVGEVVAPLPGDQHQPFPFHAYGVIFARLAGDTQSVQLVGVQLGGDGVEMVHERDTSW